MFDEMIGNQPCRQSERGGNNVHVSLSTYQSNPPAHSNGAGR